MQVELCFAETGTHRTNAGDAELPESRLEPSRSSFLRYFPEAWVTDLGERSVAPIFEESHPRYPWRFNDLYQAVGLLESKADFVIAIDSDLVVVSEDVRTILPLAEAFGLCLPVNGRHFVYRDAQSTCDGGELDDPTEGMGMALATGLWAFDTQHYRARALLEEYVAQMQTRPCRGPLALWRAQYATGIHAYALPPQWLVTGNMPKLEHPIVLHAGHTTVTDLYPELMEGTPWQPPF